MPDRQPYVNFHFQVEFGGAGTMGFSEVSGLNAEVEVVEYRAGNSPEYHTMKIPGRAKYSNVVLKRGVGQGTGDLYEWFQQSVSRTVERRDVTIKLLNEQHEPVMTWKLSNAWPCKIEGPDLNATGNEVAIETVELAHERLVIDQ